MKKQKAQKKGRVARTKKRSGKLFSRLRDGWALAPLCVWGLGQLEAHIWLGALVAELYFQLGLLLVLMAVVWALRQRPVRGAAWLLSGVLFLLPLWPLHRPMHLTPAEGGPVLRVAQSHLDDEVLSPAKLTTWLVRDRLDVVSITGLQRSRSEATPGAHGYLAVVGHTRGSLLFARKALTPESSGRGHVRIRAGHCDLDIRQREAPFVLAPSTLAARSAQLDALTEAAKDKRSILVGALGSRSSAHDLQKLMQLRGLRDVRHGYGRLATAPGFLGPLGLPLDHILVHGWIAVRDASTAAPLVPGAHRTLQATLALTEPRCR